MDKTLFLCLEFKYNNCYIFIHNISVYKKLFNYNIKEIYLEYSYL